MNDDGKAWFALAVIPRKEKVTALTLRVRGYEDFLPMYSVRKRWSDRIKTVEEPLFPGYVFCRLDPRWRLPVLKLPTVLHILSLGKIPQAINNAEIAALQTVCQAGIHAVPCPFLTAGAKVTIREGPLSGVEGVLIDEKQTRLILSVTLLQRSVSVEVDRGWIAPVRIYRAY